jgi:hypothetical protein
VSDVISSSYGNPGMGSCGVGVVSEGGVIGFGDEGGVIGFGVDVRVGVGVVVVMFFIVFGIPHICDSVVLTNLSFGLLGSHNFDFSTGETVVLVGDGEVGGDGDVGEGPKGSTGDRDVCFSSWAWLTLIIPISNTALADAIAAAAAAAAAANTTAVRLILRDIFVLNIDLLTVCIID